jgi:hypothetical protein
MPEVLKIPWTTQGSTDYVVLLLAVLRVRLGIWPEAFAGGSLLSRCLRGGGHPHPPSGGLRAAE